VLVFAAVCAYITARVFQANHLPTDPTPVLLLIMIVAPAAGAFAVTIALRRRQRGLGTRDVHQPSSLAHSRGWLLTCDDTTRVPDHFPDAPFLRSRSSVGIQQSVAIDGRTDGHRWWAVEQLSFTSEGMGRDERCRTVFVTAVPGVGLPPLLVRGRDSVGIVDWFPRAQAVSLESDDLNRQMLVWAESGHLAAAHAVMNPLMMEYVLAGLPDGAALTFRAAPCPWCWIGHSGAETSISSRRSCWGWLPWSLGG
jgi:hypothetical protein